MKTFLILFLFVTISYGQSVQGIGSSTGIITPAQAGMSFREVPIQGSPYIYQIFKKGQTIINGKTVSDALMRYDAYNDAIEIKNENNRVRTLLRRNNIVAIIDGTIYMVRDYFEAGNKKIGYFNPLNEGYTRLLRKPKKKFIQAENADHGYDTFTPAQYVDISTYYMQRGNEPAQEVKLSKNKIVRFLNDKAGILKKFITENKLEMRSESDVIALIEYYNTLENNETM